MTFVLPFQSQLLPLQVSILHVILQHIIVLRMGHSDEATRLDGGLLDSLIKGQPINLRYVIMRYMLSTLTVSHRLIPYGNIITKILWHFQVPLRDAVYTETKRIAPDAMTDIGFSRKNGKWIKTSKSKNWDTLVAPKDDWMLNDIYPLDQLLDFRLGAHPSPPRGRSIPQPSTNSNTEERGMDNDLPSTLEQPSAPEQLLASV